MEAACEPQDEGDGAAPTEPAAAAPAESTVEPKDLSPPSGPGAALGIAPLQPEPLEVVAKKVRTPHACSPPPHSRQRQDTSLTRSPRAQRPWTAEEDDAVRRLVAIHGTQWAHMVRAHFAMPVCPALSASPITGATLPAGDLPARPDG